MAQAANTGVVYLYRFAEGEAPVRRFLDSYREHSAGVAHDLHVILKGFPNDHALAAARALFGSLRINAIELGDAGYDIGSYLAAARSVVNQQLLFLNTFSEILADDWLAHFVKALAIPGVGLVGATGSWQSARSGYEAALRRILRHPLGGFNEYFGAAAFAAEEDRGGQKFHGQSSGARLLRRLTRAILYPLRVYEFQGHPNPHIRTNAFIVHRHLFLSLRSARFKRKLDAYKFESGRHSMTRQIMARGLRPVVVDRRGKIYEIPEWKSSSTFWVGSQANLLVADNQTSDYSTGSPKRRGILENYAWDSPRLWKTVGSI